MKIECKKYQFIQTIKSLYESGLFMGTDLILWNEKEQSLDDWMKEIRNKEIKEYEEAVELLGGLVCTK